MRLITTQAILRAFFSIRVKVKVRKSRLMINAIKDSIDFRNKCGISTDESTAIASFDAVGLCTNISHTFRLEAVRYFLLKYKEDIDPRFNMPSFLESVDFILKNNTCAFDK